MIQHRAAEFASLTRPGDQIMVIDGDYQMLCTVDILQHSSAEMEQEDSSALIVSINAEPTTKPSIWRELLTRSYWADLVLGL